jgi:hypothetical protein
VHKTPKQINEWLAENSHRADAPEQWLGTEPNARRKDWDSAKVRACIFASWDYSTSAGNIAIPVVYTTINDAGPDYLADRSYFPSTPRDLRLMTSKGIPIFGIESKHQLRDFDVVGTSISYPVLAINFAKQLLQSDIPATWADRYDHVRGEWVPGRYQDPGKWPMVLVGGQMYGAPEVVSNIADVVVCGEIEDEPGQPGLKAVFRRINVFKEKGLWTSDRLECYRLLAWEFNWLYVPALVETKYQYEDRPSVANSVSAIHGADHPVEPSKQVAGIVINAPGIRAPFRKRYVKNLDAVPPLVDPPVLFRDPGMGAGDIEAGRGCQAWCSFCALSWRQKPYRQRSVPVLVNAAKELVSNTGATRVTPFAPDFPLYPEKKRLVTELAEQVTDEVDTSSVRVDDFIADPSYALLQTHTGMDSITLGVEGNSQRMRDLVGKGVTDKEVLDAVDLGLRSGVRKFKLYMIASLPGEDDGDIERIMSLAKRIADMRDSVDSKAKFVMSWSPMLIEGNTPFEWFAPPSAKWSLGERLSELKELRIDTRLGGKAAKDRFGFFQLTQRASREVGTAMVEALIDHDAIGCWGGAPRGLYDMVEERLQARGFLNGFADAYDERDLGDLFGWEHIDQGVSVELMWETYQTMAEFLEMTNSENYDELLGDSLGSESIARCDEQCQGNRCGMCDREDLLLRKDYIASAQTELHQELSDVKVLDQSSIQMRVRARVHRDVNTRMVPNEHHLFAIRRAANRAGLPIAKRSIRFSSDHIGYRDWTFGTDYVEFALTKKLQPLELDARMVTFNDELSANGVLSIVGWEPFPGAGKSLLRDVDFSLYTMNIPEELGRARARLKLWEAAETWPMTVRTDTFSLGVQREEVDAKRLVMDAWLAKNGSNVALKLLLKKGPNPYEVYVSLFDKRSWLDAAKDPAQRLGAFTASDDDVVDFFKPSCASCGWSIPQDVLSQSFHAELCPRCLDEAQGLIL